MNGFDDNLERFATEGAAPLPQNIVANYVENAGARIWYASCGSGPAVILLHGGLGHSGNWGYQVPALLARGYQVVLVDSRGHGRSTRDDRPYKYELMATDVQAVMNALNLERASVVGWSDGAVVALILAHQVPERIERVFFFGCAMDPSGLKEITASTPEMDRCIGRHVRDYAELSSTPDDFKGFADAVGVMMATEPNYTAAELEQIATPVAVVQSEYDEFILPEHAAYLARTLPNGSLVELKGVSHFAPLQRPAEFNQAVLGFLDTLA